jgi:Ser/Thr protein kinase RdoA (MazF antagonist)
MLMHELSGELLGDTGVESWGEGLRLLARLHRTWVGRDGDLLALGGQDRTLRSLALELAGVLEAVDLPGDERDRLERALPRLREACSALASGPLPQTLVHGDFHPWNLMLGRGELRIFDWSDACVAHPLFDLPTFLERTDDEAAREGLLHAYLEGWADVAPLDELRALAEIAEPLAHVHHAVSYLRILDALEPDDRWYFAGEPRRWLLGAVELVEAVR